MKRLIFAILCVCLLASAAVVSAQDSNWYNVTYVGNNCLASVPTDENQYRSGENVTVLFDPVTYINGLIFYGWDWNDDGVADFGYAYNNFTMPAKDVTMKAICISSYSPAPAAPAPSCHACPPAPSFPLYYGYENNGGWDHGSWGWGYGDWGWGYSGWGHGHHHHH